jgi:hypothetical protein
MSTDDRLADVCWSYGTTAVSPITTVTHSTGAPSSPAAIWAKIVREPLAHVRGAGVDDDAAVGEQATVEYESPVVGPSLRPTRCRGRPAGGRASPADQARPPDEAPAATPRRPACPRDERVAGPGEVAQPQLQRVDLEARGPPRPCSIRSPRSACGLPNPRNAVDGTVCDSTLRATIRTVGQLYGPVEV